MCMAFTTSEDGNTCHPVSACISGALLMQLQGMVSELKASEAVLKDGTVIPYGTAVWSTGVGPTPFITALPFAKTARGRLAVDESLRVLVHPEKGEAPGPDSVSEVSMWNLKQQASVLMDC